MWDLAVTCAHGASQPHILLLNGVPVWDLSVTGHSQPQIIEMLQYICQYILYLFKGLKYIKLNSNRRHRAKSVEEWSQLSRIVTKLCQTPGLTRENRPTHTSSSAIWFVSILEIQNHWRKAFGIANEINMYLALPITRNVASSFNNVLKSKPNRVNSPSFRSKEAVKTSCFSVCFQIPGHSANFTKLQEAQYPATPAIQQLTELKQPLLFPDLHRHPSQCGALSRSTVSSSRSSSFQHLC